MICVIPVASSTPGLDTLATAIRKKGGYPEHCCRIIAPREDEELAYQIGDELAKVFRDVTTATLMPLSESGKELQAKNPRAFNNLLSNQMFRAAMAFFRDYNYAEDEVQDAPMLYYTPTYRPTQQGWLNDLQSEFFLKGSPGVMARIEAQGIRTDRNKKNPDVKQMTVGPVIFGRSCFDQLPTLDFLSPAEHWRDRLVHELAAICVPTKQIGGGTKSLLKEMQAVKVDA